MLPALLFNNMEGSSNQLNNNLPAPFGIVYDDNLILNSVRNRKKNSELPCCPVCSCTIRTNELESHFALEIERLGKVNSGGCKRKLSNSGSGNSFAMPGSSTNTPGEQQEVDVSGCTGSDVYQRVQANRMRRLRWRSRRSSPPATGECPVCGARLPVTRLQRHALRCLRRTGASVGDDDVPDTSSEDGSIDVENDEPEGGGSFGAEYRWCGQWRVRAAALQDPDARLATPVRRASVDTALVVDGDEDTELYGPAQYSPSRIAADAESATRDDDMEGRESVNVDANASAAVAENGLDDATKQNGLIEASVETRIQALKVRIRELEARSSSGSEMKCLICLGPYASPAVSIQCWHVYCEVCWLESLRAKKICPQCNAITTSQHLRRIYM